MTLPKLRFKSFEDGYTQVTLGDIAEIKRGAASQHLKYVSDSMGAVRLLRINDFLKNDPVFIESTKDTDKYKVKEGDLLIAGTGATAGIVFIVPKSFDNYAYSYNAPRIRVTGADNRFVYHYLKSDVILRQQAGLFVGNAQPFLDTDAIRGFDISLPPLLEQQKIAEFLSSIDEKIFHLTKKYELLCDFKLGVMQKIFNQDIKFKFKQDKQFPDWNFASLSEILKYEQPTKYLVSSKDYSDTYKTPVLTAGKTFLLGYTDEIKGLYQDLPVIIFDDFTTAIKFVDFPFKVKSSAIKMLKNIDGNTSLRYIYEAMSMLHFNTGDEHKRYWISEYSNLEIPVPCIQEQLKIVSFAETLDKKISLIQKQLVKTKEYKQSLMQQMFI
jgi:type I restriction enzyme S subunit